jgi:CheY-like chemotaxis protein
MMTSSSLTEPSGNTCNAESKQPDTRAGRILLIEDDRELAQDMIGELLARSYEVVHTEPGRKGAAEARRGKYDLLIMDALLPECDRTSIIRELRRDQIRLPVLVASSLGAVTDRVRGLKLGGDDYLTIAGCTIGTIGQSGSASAPPAGGLAPPCCASVRWNST